MRTRAAALTAIAVTLALTACTSPGPSEPGARGDGDGAGASASPTPAGRPALDDLALDADALVRPDRDSTLRMGEPVPHAADSALAEWDADACDGGTAQPGDAYSGAWSAAYPAGKGFYGGSDTQVFQLDSSGTRDGDVDWIVVLGTAIPTTKGVRVGDPVADVHAVYPDPAGVVHLGLSDLYVVAGTVGQLTIEVTVDDGSGYWQPDQVGRVFALSSRPVGSDPVGLVATDDVPGCKA